LIVISQYDNPINYNWQDLICKQYELWTKKPAPDMPLIPFEDVLKRIALDDYQKALRSFKNNFS
jgi:hypothetical protein